MNADQKSLETGFSIAICRQLGDKWQSKSLFLTIFHVCSSIGLTLLIAIYLICISSRVAQSVTCLVTDAKLTADPGVTSLIPARSHTLVEIDHEIISTVILLPSAESFMKGCCQLQAKVCARLLVNCLFKLAQEKVWLGELTVPQ